MDPREYAKAIIAALGAGLTAFTAAQVAGKVTTAGWVTIAVATVTTGLTVFVVPNKDAKPDTANIKGVPS